MTKNNSNAELAKAIAQFADALAGFDHLPALDNVQWHADGSVYPSVQSHGDVAAQLRDMHAWADAFDRDVEVVRNDSYAYVSFEFELRGFKVVMHETMYRDRAEALVAELPGGQSKVTLPPNQFGALVDRLADTEDQRKWRAAYKRHYEASRSHNAPHENAAEYAEGKTVEELGPNPVGDVRVLLQEA